MVTRVRTPFTRQVRLLRILVDSNKRGLTFVGTGAVILWVPAMYLLLRNHYQYHAETDLTFLPLAIISAIVMIFGGAIGYIVFNISSFCIAISYRRNVGPYTSSVVRDSDQAVAHFECMDLTQRTPSMPQSILTDPANYYFRENVHHMSFDDKSDN